MIPTKLVVGTTLATEAPKRRSRRGIPNYPLEFRRQLAKLACEPGVSVARLAMEHGLNPNLVFKWHRALRAGDAFASDDVAVGILPITGRPSAFSVFLYPQRQQRSLRFACLGRQRYGLTLFHMSFRAGRILPIRRRRSVHDGPAHKDHALPLAVWLKPVSTFGLFNDDDV